MAPCSASQASTATSRTPPSPPRSTPRAGSASRWVELMRISELWRYPVKSMQGERLPAVKVQADGLDGDRRWGVRDEHTGPLPACAPAPRFIPPASGTCATRPQPGLNRDLDVHRTLARHHGGNLGVWTAILNGGTIAENDIAQLVADSQPDHRSS